MKKRFLTIENVVLTGLVTLLGIGSCKTAKRQVKETNTEHVYVVDTIREPPPQPKVKGREKEMPVVYGPPATHFTQFGPMRDGYIFEEGNNGGDGNDD